MIEQAKKMGKMMWGCVALIAVVAVLVVGGVSGSWVFLPFLIMCGAMLGMMMWMMMGMGHHAEKK
jgi:hypothetical protein